MNSIDHTLSPVISRLMDLKKNVKLPSTYQPSEYDVICGRGKGHYCQPGNKKFHKIVTSHLEMYRTLRTKFEKSLEVNRIIENVLLQNGGNVHFVRQSGPESWESLDYDAIRDTVGHAIQEALSSERTNKDSLDKNKNSIRVTREASTATTERSSLDIRETISQNMMSYDSECDQSSISSDERFEEIDEDEDYVKSFDKNSVNCNSVTIPESVRIPTTADTKTDRRLFRLHQTEIPADFSERIDTSFTNDGKTIVQVVFDCSSTRSHLQCNHISNKEPSRRYSLPTYHNCSTSFDYSHDNFQRSYCSSSSNSRDSALSRDSTFSGDTTQSRYRPSSNDTKSEYFQDLLDERVHRMQNPEPSKRICYFYWNGMNKMDDEKGSFTYGNMNNDKSTCSTGKIRVLV